MGKVVAVTNQKGGVGKTTTAINLACGVAMLKKRVLVIDLDPQGNTTSGLGVRKAGIEHSTYSVLMGNCTPEEAIIVTPYYQLSVMPSNIDLSGAGIELVELERREARLRDAVLRLREMYDFIFIDCPPSLDLLTLNGLCAADTILVPIQCEFYALEGLSELMATVRRVKSMYNPYLDIEGVLMTMYDGRLNLTLQVAKELKKYYKTKLYKTTIPRNVRLSEAPSHGQPIQIYDVVSKGAESYCDLAREFLKNNK